MVDAATIASLKLSINSYAHCTKKPIDDPKSSCCNRDLGCSSMSVAKPHGPRD